MLDVVSSHAAPLLQPPAPPGLLASAAQQLSSAFNPPAAAVHYHDELAWPLRRVALATAGSFAVWLVLHMAAYWVSRRAWRGFTSLGEQERAAWANKIASSVHAAAIAAGEAATMLQLRGDKLYAVSWGHYFWPCVMLGYLAYDSAYALSFGSTGCNNAAILLHHAVCGACCVVGLKFGVNGFHAAGLVALLESTTPLLNAVHCVRMAGAHGGRAYVALGLTLVAQYFVCRVVLGTWVTFSMARHMLNREPVLHWWCIMAIAAFGTLCALNYVWFGKIVINAVKRLRPGRKQSTTGGSIGRDKKAT